MPGVNCVDTDTGLAANVATEGLVQGGTYGTGCAATEDTGTGCDPHGGYGDRNAHHRQLEPDSINDDVLSCYFTNGTTSIADIAKASYSGGAGSPRLDPQVAALLLRPGAGHPADHRRFRNVLDHRLPGGVPHRRDRDRAPRSRVRKTGTSDNGVCVQGNDIKQIKVVFFNDDALPTDGDIPLIDYLGTGNRVIRLID